MAKGKLNTYRLMVKTFVQIKEYAAFNDIWKTALLNDTAKTCNIPLKRLQEIIKDVSIISEDEVQKLAKHFYITVKGMQGLINKEKRKQEKLKGTS